MIILGISTKIPWGNFGFSILVFKILGNSWGVGFLVASAFVGWGIDWYESYQRKKAIICALDDLGVVEMKEKIKEIGEECKKIRKTINPYDNYMDESF